MVTDQIKIKQTKTNKTKYCFDVGGRWGFQNGNQKNRQDFGGVVLGGDGGFRPGLILRKMGPEKN